MKPKPYESYAYMKLQYITKGKTIDEISDELKVSHNTIRSALLKHGLIRGK